MKQDWEQERDEYIAGRLMDDDERMSFEAQRNEDLGLGSRRDAQASWGAERAEVENAFPDGQGWRALGLPFEMSEDAA